MQETLVQFLEKICWRRDRLPTLVFLRFSCGSAGKESTCNVGDLGLIPGLGRSPGEGKGYPVQYSGLENSMDCRGHGVTKSQTQLSNFHFQFMMLAVGFSWKPSQFEEGPLLPCWVFTWMCFWFCHMFFMHLFQWFSNRGDFAPRGYLAVSGDMFYWSQLGAVVLLASSGCGSRML